MKTWPLLLIILASASRKPQEQSGRIGQEHYILRVSCPPPVLPRPRLWLTLMKVRRSQGVHDRGVPDQSPAPKPWNKRETIRSLPIGPAEARRFLDCWNTCPNKAPANQVIKACMSGHSSRAQGTTKPMGAISLNH